MPLSLPDSLHAASDSLKASITAADSLATQLAASDSLSFWQKFWEALTDPSQWTLVNVIATLAGLFTIIGGLYFFIRWLMKGAAESSSVAVEKSENSLIVSGSVVQSTLNVYLDPPGKPTLSRREFERMLNEYLRWVANAYTKARLYGLESLRTGGAPVRKLSEVFVPVKLRRFQSLDRQAKEKIGMHVRDNTIAYRSYLVWVMKKRGEGEEVGLRNLLNTAQRLAIVGGAGSGKSTVLAYLAASLANAATAHNIKLPFALPRKKLLIPLLIPLRYYREYLSLSELSPQDRLRSPQTGKLAAFISWYLKRRSPALERCEDFFERLLLGGGCLLMLDGLDEVVSREERGRVRQEVEDIANDMYPNNYVIVTAREAGYQENAVFGDDFTRLDVQRLEDDQIQALVHNWCVQLYPGEEENRTRELMDSIREINSLRRDRDLPPLISTPLMTTMVVSVKWGETELPRERAKLYEAAVKVILQAQYIPDDPARKELVDWGGPWEDQRDWLAHLALRMHMGGAASAAIPETQVCGILGETVSAPNLTKFVQACRYRGSLFEERAELFQFIHLTFQEFLAARCLAKQRSEGLAGLERHITDPWWREVFLLTYGFAQVDYAPYAKQYFHWLSTRPGKGDLALAGLELAGAALLELEKPNPEVRHQQALALMRMITDESSETTARTRVRCADTMARLGDPRLEVTTLEHMQFCSVPGGPFWMGSPDTDKEALSAEKPLHLNEQLDYEYWLSRFPITVAQYQLFINATGHQPTDPDSLKDPANRPVRNVTWHEAIKFCDWLTRYWCQQGQLPQKWRVQLPSEAEWEKAARGGLYVPNPVLIQSIRELITPSESTLIANEKPKRHYPWGDKFDVNHANYNDTMIEGTSAVGCFPDGQSPYGCEEMSGNVWEWTRSLCQPYPYVLTDGRDNLKASDSKDRAVRGGSFDNAQWGVRCCYRNRYYPDLRVVNVGFRVVLSP